MHQRGKYEKQEQPCCSNQPRSFREISVCIRVEERLSGAEGKLDCQRTPDGPFELFVSPDQLHEVHGHFDKQESCRDRVVSVLFG